MPITLRLLLPVCLAVIVTACGSSCPAGVDGHEFDRFPAVVPPTSAQLPGRPLSIDP